MRMKNALLTSLLVVLGTGAVQAGELSARLENVLAAKTDDTPLTVLFVMRGSVDVQALDLSLHAQKAPLAARHAIVIETLQDAAKTAQAPFIADLTAREASGQIEAFRPHWIVNGVLVTASPAIIRELALRDDVDIVEPNLVPELIEPVARYDAATTSIGITPGVVNVGARRVWDELGIRGEGALIGGLDTGCDGNHPALASRWRGLHAPWQECWLDVVGSPSTFPSDDNSHGTHTMGTMCGLAPDDTIGVAPGAEWIAANPIAQGVGGGFDADIIACFEWFTDPDGDPNTMDDVPDVVQNSWGVHEGFGYPDCDSRWWNVMDACEAAGPVIVFAAGNEGPTASTLRSPADRATTIYNCFSVGATNPQPPYTIADFSSRGPAGPNCGPVENRIKPEVSAPGVGIYSSIPGGGYTYYDGTSMACPHVAGVVALMRSANPNLDGITIKQVLMDTAHDLGAGGDDNTYGHGFIDAYAAVTAVMGGIGTISGVVTDQATGLPLEGAHVSVDGSVQTDATDATGAYSVLAPAGTTMLRVSDFGYGDLATSVDVPDGDTVTVNVAMDAVGSATLSGTVLLPDGSTPAAGALITVLDAPIAAVTSNASGQYSLTLPASGDFTLQVAAGAQGVLTQTVPFLGDLDLDLRLDSLTGDSFETGDFTGLAWQQVGSPPWYVQSDVVHSGTEAAHSGAVSGTGYSQIQTVVDCGDGGDITFWLKVSSQSGIDVLQFFDGSAVVGEWSGEVDWIQYTRTVTSGTHTFRWRYLKTTAQSSGDDCAWLDDIVFPGGGSTTPLLVAAPQPVAVTVTSGLPMATVPLYLFDMGGADLSWSASESTSWLQITPLSGTVNSWTYGTLACQVDGSNLRDGVYTAPVQITSNDPTTPSMTVTVELTVDSGNATATPDAPGPFTLIGAVPNPFNPTTVVRFNLPSAQPAQLSLYDVQGRLVRTLVDGPRPAGLNEVRWDGHDAMGRTVASGTYFARLHAGAQSSVKTLTLVR